MGTSNYNRVMAGRRSRAVGDYFEQMIIAASAFTRKKEGNLKVWYTVATTG